MDAMTFEAAVATCPRSTSPHYDRPTLDRLLACAARLKDAPELPSHIRTKLANLPNIEVWGDKLAVSSDVTGTVSWMEDFTLFAIHPFNWAERFPDAADYLNCNFSVTRCVCPETPYGRRQSVLVHDTLLTMPAKKRSDINRSRQAVGPYTVVSTVDDGHDAALPPIAELAAGVRRWDRHALSGDYFLWQWMWVTAAGYSVCVTNDEGSAWAGIVEYPDFAVFTAFHSTGGSNLGTVALYEALIRTAKPVLLTVPLDAEAEAQFNSAKYETYKRKFANSSMDVFTFECVTGVTEIPTPPYLNLTTGQFLEA